MSTSKKIIDMLKCPVCGEDVYISDNEKSLFCKGQRRHCFDFSADGYLSMTTQGSGDSKQMVNARRSFLSGDYYLPLCQRLCELAEKYAPNGVLLDAGSGEGYYTNRLASVSDIALGFDLSKFGASAAAKYARHQGTSNTFYATASVFELPVKDSTCDCVVNIFAPCAENEYMRVLKEGGVLIVVGAGREHLMGLKRVLYDSTYENTERADLPTAEPCERVSLRYDITVKGQANIENLFSMTPYYWRTSEADKQKLLLLDELTTELEFEIYIYIKTRKE